MKNKKIEPRWERIITALILFVLVLILITKLNVKQEKEKPNDIKQEEIKKEVLHN